MDSQQLEERERWMGFDKEKMPGQQEWIEGGRRREKQRWSNSERGVERE